MSTRERVASGWAFVVLGLVACGGVASPRLTDAGGDAGSQQAPEGSLLIDPQLLDFGNVVANSQIAKTITLTNTADVDQTVTPSAITGPSASLFSLGQVTPLLVKAGATGKIQVTYAPLMPSAAGGGDLASFTISTAEGPPVSVSLQGMAVQSGLQITPNPLDFNFVQPGQQRTMRLTLNNVGNLDVNISSIAVTESGDGQVFALRNGQATSLTLSAGQTAVADVTFTPLAIQQEAGLLQIKSDDNLPEQLVELKGYGGGAAITCTPSKLDFGTAAAGLTTTLPVLCTNNGSDVLVNGQPDPNAQLQISGFRFSSTNGIFSAAIDPLSPQGPLLANQSVLIDVSYMPTATETDNASMTVVSNVTTPPAPPVIALTGQAVQEPKCHYNLTPSSLSFGEVKPLNDTDPPYTQAFTITNLGPNECLVNGVNVLPGSDSAFNTPQIVSQRLSPPGTGGAFPTELSVPVSFFPFQIGDYAGVVGFSISDPDGPNVRVQLSGTGGQSCFSLKPDQLAFGVLGSANGASCTSSRTFMATNGCTQPVTLSGLTVTAASDVFSLDAGTVPVTVNAGQSASVEVSFSPMVAGSYFGSAQIQTDLQQASFGVFFTGTLASSNTWTDRFSGNTPTADILWVMDTADSTERQEVATYASDFISSLVADGIDFQIGVTSTDLCGGGMAEDGRLVPCSGCHISSSSVPQIITQDDPSAGSDLKTLMGLGGASDDDCGIADDELFFQVGYDSLVGRGATANGVLGFVRPNAYLAVITVNGDNDDDASTQTPDFYANEFLSIKGSDHPELFSWSYINPSSLGTSGGHQPFNGLPQRISSMLDLVGGVALDSTQSDWYKGVLDLWQFMLASNKQFSLSGTPDPSTIKVYLDGPPPDQATGGVPAGAKIDSTNSNGSWNWRYEAVSNAVQVNPQTLSLQNNDVLYVEYVLTCP
jgi:hypothetical protein